MFIKRSKIRLFLFRSEKGVIKSLRCRLYKNSAAYPTFTSLLAGQSGKNPGGDHEPYLCRCSFCGVGGRR